MLEWVRDPATHSYFNRITGEIYTKRRLLSMPCMRHVIHEAVHDWDDVPLRDYARFLGLSERLWEKRLAKEQASVTRT